MERRSTDVEIEADGLSATDGIRKWLSHVRGGITAYWLRTRVQPALLLSADDLSIGANVDDDNRLRVRDSGVFGDYVGDVVALDALWPSNVGDVKLMAAQSTAGADPGLPSVAASGVDRLYMVEQIMSVYKAAAVVATRVHKLDVRIGHTNPAVMTVVQDWLSTGITLTTGEQGRILVPRAPGLVQLNDNGTFTTADESPLPMYLTEGGSLRTVTTNKNAGDAIGIAALVRRVA